MDELSAVTIVVDLPTGYTVAGAMLARFGPFDDANDIVNTVRRALGDRWQQASVEEIRSHYSERYTRQCEEGQCLWEQLSLFERK